MTRSLAGACALAVVLGACGTVKPEGDEHRVGGDVRGLWDGADGVVLQLEADGVNTLLTASANGKFSFPKPLGSGRSYAVTVATSPASHSCVVDSGGNGTVADVDIMNVSVTCSGPVMAIELSGQWGSTFDSTKDTQTFAGSIVVQDIALTVSGSSLSSVTVNGTAVPLGKPTAPLALPLGKTTVPVALTAGGGLSKTYQLVFDRGGRCSIRSCTARPRIPGRATSLAIRSRCPGTRWRSVRTPTGSSAKVAVRDQINQTN